MPLFNKKNAGRKSEAKESQLSNSQLFNYFTTLLFQCLHEINMWKTANPAQKGSPQWKATELQSRCVREAYEDIRNQFNSAEGCSVQQLTDHLSDMLLKHEILRKLHIIPDAVVGYEPPNGIKFITEEMNKKLSKYLPPPAESPKATNR